MTRKMPVSLHFVPRVPYLPVPGPGTVCVCVCVRVCVCVCVLTQNLGL